MNRILLLAVVFAGGCGALLLHEGQLRNRASYDLQCAPDKLEITEIDKRTAGVDGCGRRGTYVYTSDTWILNSPGER
jgi:hypothetical protein